MAPRAAAPDARQSIALRQSCALGIVAVNKALMESPLRCGTIARRGQHLIEAGREETEHLAAAGGRDVHPIERAAEGARHLGHRLREKDLLEARLAEILVRSAPQALERRLGLTRRALCLEV